MCIRDRIWSGSAVSIPSGWQLCDGTNGSPDLRDKFVVGAGSTYAVDATGGSKDSILVLHSHTINNHTHSFSDSFSGNTDYFDTSHTHGFSSNATANVQTAYGTGSNALYGGSTNAMNSGTVPISFTLSDTGGPSANSNHRHDFSGSVSGTTGNPSDTGTNNQGSSGTDANLPPYYSLCYIYCTAAGSNQTFLGLGDTPGSYTANQWLKVNSAGNGVEFTTAPTGGATNLGDLNDVDTANAASGKILIHSGTEWQVGSWIQADWTETNANLGSYIKNKPSNILTSVPTLDAVLGAGNTSTKAATVGNFQCANLTVTGTTTTVNSNTVNIGDSNLTLNSDETGTPSQNLSLIHISEPTRPY